MQCYFERKYSISLGKKKNDNVTVEEDIIRRLGEMIINKRMSLGQILMYGRRGVEKLYSAE